MKAVLCTRIGGPDDLEYADIDEPVAGPGEAVVRVEAAALNFFDTLIIANKYQRKPALPFSPAAELAGVVESLGPGVTGFRPGDRVAAYVGHGAAREKIAVDASLLVKIPEGLDVDRAAGVPVIYGTALHALRDRGHLKSGETLAVLGASGGVGLAAVELGKLFGARVIACASSDEKIAFAKRHGADDGLNYSRDNLKDGLRQLTGGRGANVIFDPVGGVYTEQALRSTALLGRLLIIGFAAGEIPRVPMNLPLLRSCDIVGVQWGAWAEQDRAGYRAATAELLQWCGEGKLSAHVHEVVPLSETPRALKSFLDRKPMGKVILRPLKK